MANSVDDFTRTIQAYLETFAANDEAFAAKFANPEKNITDCCKYIVNTVQKTKRNGFADAEIYGHALHYYEEEKVDVGGEIKGVHIVSNHVIELTEEEKQQAQQKAREEAIAEASKNYKSTIKLSEEDKAVVKEAAKEVAVKKAIAERAELATKKATKKKAIDNPDFQPSLFD